jgi:hypothetical protein
MKLKVWPVKSVRALPWGRCSEQCIVVVRYIRTGVASPSADPDCFGQREAPIPSEFWLRWSERKTWRMYMDDGEHKVSPHPECVEHDSKPLPPNRWEAVAWPNIDPTRHRSDLTKSGDRVETDPAVWRTNRFRAFARSGVVPSSRWRSLSCRYASSTNLPENFPPRASVHPLSPRLRNRGQLRRGERYRQSPPFKGVKIGL